MNYLTKSKFKLGLECPTKLYYVDKPIFPNQKKEDPFLEQLANGGFQVEALARLKYAEGEMIDTRNIMMDVYHEDFRYSIAIDDRIKKILNSWNYEIRNYDEAEQFLLEIAERAKLNGWELDRLMYNFKDEFIVN